MRSWKRRERLLFVVKLVKLSHLQNARQTTTGKRKRRWNAYQIIAAVDDKLPDVVIGKLVERVIDGVEIPVKGTVVNGKLVDV